MILVEAIWKKSDKFDMFPRILQELEGHWETAPDPTKPYQTFSLSNTVPGSEVDIHIVTGFFSDEDETALVNTIRTAATRKQPIVVGNFFITMPFEPADSLLRMHAELMTHTKKCDYVHQCSATSTRRTRRRGSIDAPTSTGTTSARGTVVELCSRHPGHRHG